MFTDYFNYTFFVAESIFVLLIVLYIHLRINKVLGKERKILPFVNMTFKYMKYVVAFFLVFFVVIGLIDILLNDANFLVLSGPVFMYLSFDIFYKKINGFNYNDKGIVIADQWNTVLGFEAIKWENIIMVEFDKDINQALYGFYIQIKTYKKPVRCWIERKNLNEIKELFTKYNVVIN